MRCPWGLPGFDVNLLTTRQMQFWMQGFENIFKRPAIAVRLKMRRSMLGAAPPQTRQAFALRDVGLWRVAHVSRQDHGNTLNSAYSRY